MMQVCASNVVIAELNHQLFEAAEEGDAPLCLTLLERGAQIEAANDEGWRPLHLAAWCGHAGTCLALLEYGANVSSCDAFGCIALHYAAFKGNEQTCLLLLEYGSDPAIKDGQSQTPLNMAIENEQEGCANVLRAWQAAQAARCALSECAVVASAKP